MELSIFELAGTLLGGDLEGENLAGGTNPSGTGHRNAEFLAKSTRVHDLGSISFGCGVRKTLSGPSPAIHVPSQELEQVNIPLVNVEGSRESRANNW